MLGRATKHPFRITFTFLLCCSAVTLFTIFLAYQYFQKCNIEYSTFFDILIYWNNVVSLSIINFCSSVLALNVCAYFHRRFISSFADRHHKKSHGPLHPGKTKVHHEKAHVTKHHVLKKFHSSRQHQRHRLRLKQTQLHLKAHKKGLTFAESPLPPRKYRYSDSTSGSTVTFLISEPLLINTPSFSVFLVLCSSLLCNVFFFHFLLHVYTISASLCSSFLLCLPSYIIF